MVEYIQRLLSSWQAGQIVNVSHTMSRLAMEIAVKAILNYDVANDTEGIGKAFDIVMKEVIARFNNAVPIPDSIPTPGNLHYRGAIQYLDNMIYGMIRQRQADPKDWGDLLPMLLQAHNEDGSAMTDQQLRDEIVTIFMAGMGSAFAMMEAKLVLATVVQRFHLELAPGQMVVPHFSGSLRPKQEIEMVLTPRRLPSQ